MTRCKGQGCLHYTLVDDQLCERCRRLTAIGAVVKALGWTVTIDPVWNEATLAALDAVAYLLTDHAQLRRRHQKEQRDEDLYAQRAARDAHAEGIREGRDTGGGW